MKALSWILGIIVLALIGYLLYHAFQDRKRTASEAYSEVAPDSVQSFRERAAELRSEAELLRARIETLKLWDRPAVQARLEALGKRIAELDLAIERWERSSRTAAQSDLYHQCVRLYGEATGACQSLALDTIPSGE